MNCPSAFRLDPLDVESKEFKAVVHMGDLRLGLREFQM
jgi:hypothetical protein